ncbi:MAG TPA: bpX6 domain-containing protein, partial [Blastocatellia bacterium]|nr:bpX6 domain-containing protein [Blastocatellia bacterium]
MKNGQGQRKPQSLTHRGVVQAAGLLFDANVFGEDSGEDRVRSRILSVWSPSDIVYRTAKGALVLKVNRPLWLDCRRALGLPLTAAGSALLSAPLTEDELNEIELGGRIGIDQARACLILVSGGSVSTEPLTQIELPEKWLDVESYEVVQVESLGPMPSKPNPPVEPVEFNARERIPGVPPPARELGEFLKSLGEDRTSARPPGEGLGWGWLGLLLSQIRKHIGEELKRSRSGASGKNAAASGFRGWWDRVRDVFRQADGKPAKARPASRAGRSGAGRWVLAGGIAAALRRILGKLAGLGPSGGRTSRNARQPAATRAGRPAPRQPSKFMLLLRKGLIVVLREAHLAPVLGRRQARYLGDLIDRLESGDINEALKRAIPLGGKFEEKLMSPMLGVPGMRSDLSINPFVRPAGSSLGVGGDTLTYLRNLYRSMFERLSAQGRIDEAAFVLAELLRANEEAVNFLERNGRLRLAAEIAEARDLAPGIVVRQWFVAGDKERAIYVARRTGAFQDAIVRLEKTDKAKAAELRLIWAETLADAGNYLAAAETCCGVESARLRFLDWLNRAAEGGGAQGARALAYLASELPVAFADVRGKALALLEDESVEGLQSRFAFIETLKGVRPSAETKALGRAAVRAAVRDSRAAVSKLPPARLRALTEFVGDHTLRADAPPNTAYKAAWLESLTLPLKFELEAGDVGVSRIEDLVYLPDGKLAIALGESGLVLLNRAGKIVARFDEPAYKLVQSDSGNRSIVMAARGEVWRLSRVDFRTRTIEPWTEARIDCFADSYDGSVWFIAADGDFYSIDATAKRFDSLWRIPEVVVEDHRVTSIARTPSSCAFVATEDFSESVWRYSLPSMRLVSKSQVASLGLHFSSVPTSVSADGGTAEVYNKVENEPEADSSGVRELLTSRPITLSDERLRVTLAESRYVEYSLAVEGLNPQGDGLYVPPARSAILRGAWALYSGQTPKGMRACLFNPGRTFPAMELGLEGTNASVITLQDDVACVADER